MRAISLIIGIIFCSIWFYGAACLLWIVPDRNNEIQYYQDRASVWKSRAQELERLNDELKVSQNFEDLFLLCAQPRSMLNMKKLNDYVKNKKEFCLKKHGEDNS